MTKHSRQTWLILLLSFVISALLITVFLKVLKTLFVLLLILLVTPVIYFVLRHFFHKLSRKTNR